MLNFLMMIFSILCILNFPIYILMTLILMSLLISFLTLFYLNLTWLSILVILFTLGGILILFLYFVSLQELENSSFLMFWFFSLIMTILYIMNKNFNFNISEFFFNKKIVVMSLLWNYNIYIMLFMICYILFILVFVINFLFFKKMYMKF